MKFSREQYLELMAFGNVKRQMFVELFGPLTGLDREWIEQGASAEEIDMLAFDWDYVDVVYCGGKTDLLGGEEPRIVEETDEYVIEKDALGRKTKLFKHSGTIPLPLSYPVETMDDWLKVKPLFDFREERIDRDAVNTAKIRQAEGALVVATIPGGFDMPRQLMGEEKACLCYYEDPELMHAMLETFRDTSIKVLERVTDELVVDQLSVHEDLAGKSGSLVGPAQIEAFIKPYFKPVWELVSSRGAQIFDMDSDGNVNSVLDAFMDCGLNSMHPFEPAAGMDVVELRKKYGDRLRMRGGIDKHVLRKSKEDIKAELEYKMQPLMRQGGIAFGLDHRIPNGTPLENYRYYVELGREILDLPPRKEEIQGWQRMAF